MNGTVSAFQWREFDVASQLPADWTTEILALVSQASRRRTLVATSVTSREATRNIQIPVETVGGDIVRRELPWLFSLYEGLFLRLGQTCVSDTLAPATRDRYAINLNVQRGTHMRYECHVDSNPLEGLLYVTSHPQGAGGELVVSNSTTALGPEAINVDCVRIFPREGTLVFFDARQHPHYVAPLRDDRDVRVVVAMNYYTPRCSEAHRPADLDKHLGLV